MEPSEPQTAEAWFKLGTDSYFQSNEKQALRCFTEAINLNTGYYQAYAERGNIHRVLKNTQDALTDLDQSLKIHENPSAYYTKARILHKSDQKEEARKMMELGDELRPKDFLSYIHKVEILIDFGSTEEAIECCNKAIEFEPMIGHTYYLKAYALGPTRAKEALECLERAIKLAPAIAMYYRFKATCLMTLGNPQEALNCCEEAIMLNQSDSESYGLKAQIFAAMGKMQEAIQCFDQGIRVNPADQRNHIEKAILLVQCGDIQGSITTYKKAIQSDPDHAAAYHNCIGCTYVDFLDPRQSIEHFDQAIRLNPNDANIFISKGSAYFIIALYPQAAECFDQAIRLDPKSADAHIYKGASLCFMKKQREGIACLDHAISLGIRDADIYNNKGKALSELNLNEEARVCYDEGIKANPNNALIYLNKAELLHKLGKDQEAIGIYEKAYELIEIEYQKLIQIYGPEGFGDEVPKARTILMKKFIGLQEIITGTERAIVRVDSANSTAAKLIKNFNKLKEQRGKLMSKFVESLSTQNKKKLTTSKELDDLIIQVGKVEKEMMELKQNLTELQGSSQLTNRSVVQEPEILSKPEAAEKFLDMETNNPQLHSYCKTFYWTLINLFGAYKFLGTSERVEATDDTSRGRALARGAHSMSNHASDIVIAAAFEGELLCELDNIVDSLYAPTDGNNKMSILNKLLQNKYGSEFDVSLQVSNLAFFVTRVRERHIMTSHENSPTKVNPTSQTFKDKITNIKDIAFDFTELKNKNDFSATLGLEDAVLLVVYLIKNHVAITSRPDPLDTNCADIVRVGGLKQVLGVPGVAEKSHAKPAPEFCKSCSMF